MSITNVERVRRKTLFEQGLKKCCRCKVVKSVDEFTTYNCNKSDRLRGHCKECHSRDPSRIESHKRADKRNKQNWKKYKKTLECKYCGYNEDHTKLEFHHRDPTTKLFNVGELASKNSLVTERFLKEIAKCDVLCKPCHIEHHGT